MLPLSILTRIQYQHESLPDLIAGLTDEKLRRQTEPGKWSIFEQIVHLQTYQHTFFDRINKTLREDNPVFPRYTAEADPLFLDNCGKTTTDILADLHSIRSSMHAFISQLGADDLHRKATHPIYSQLSLIQWLHFFLLHEAHHLLAIFKLTGSLRAIK